MPHMTPDIVEATDPEPVATETEDAGTWWVPSQGPIRIRKTDPDPRRWAWRDLRTGQFVGQTTLAAAEAAALFELIVTTMLEAAYGTWPARLAGADHEDLACNLAGLQGLPLPAGARPARRSARDRAKRNAVLLGLVS